MKEDFQVSRGARQEDGLEGRKGKVVPVQMGVLLERVLEMAAEFSE